LFGHPGGLKLERFTIRPARASDVPALAGLAARTWSAAFGSSVSTEDGAAELREKRSEAYYAGALRTRTVLVAEADDELIGYAELGDVDIPERRGDRRAGELHRVYVDTGRQGRGVGRALVAAALRHPRLAQAPRVYLQVWEQNERAVRLYEGFGFRRVGTTRFRIGERELEDLVMVLEPAP
jgi:ribosomal protein S18 acetylase RimI-like enzyme